MTSTTSRTSADFPSIRVQSILYDLPLKNVERALVYLDNAAENARRKGVSRQISVAYGMLAPPAPSNPRSSMSFAPHIGT